MNDFDRQVTKAIEQGCPRCGHQNFMATCIEEHCYDLYPLGEQGIDYDEDDDLAGPKTITKIWCWDCNDAFPLWAAENGWIPELQEIVKGE